MANRFPLIVDSSSLQIKELPANDNIDLASSGIVNAASIGATNINVTGVITASSLSVSGNVSIAGTITYEDVTNIDSLGIVTARTGIQVLAGGVNAVGVITATSFDGSLALSDVTGLGANVSTFLATPSSSNLASAVTDETGTGSLVFSNSPTLVTPALGNASASSINASGIVTATGGIQGIGIQSGGVNIATGIITALNFVGSGNTFAVNGTTVDISISGSAGGGGGGDGTQFNTGITSTVVRSLVGIGSTVFTFPSTAGKQYLVYSIFTSNIAAGSTESNVIGAFDFNGGSRSYFAYNIPIPTGTSIELLEQPQIMNPSDSIVMRSTDYNRNGVDNAIETFITYEEKTSTDYFGIGISTTGIGVTTPVGIFTSSTYPSVVQSIRLVNVTDDGSYPITVSVTSGVVTTKLVDNLIVPKYASVELLGQPKRLLTNDIIKVEVDQINTIAVQVSGKKISS